MPTEPAAGPAPGTPHDGGPPSDPSAERRSWLEDAERRLIDGLDAALGDALRRERGAPKDARRVVVSAYDLGTECPARWAHPPQDDYAESAANAARRLGRLALRRWQPGTDLPAVVTQVLSDTEDWPSGLRSWFEELDRAGRATVSAAASTWAVGALGAVDGRTGLQWVRQNETVDVAGRAVRLRGSWDAFSGTRSRPTTLLVLSGGLPGADRDRLAAGYAALVAGLGPRVVPERVRIGSAASGDTRAVTISPGVLERAVDRVVELVAHAAAPDLAPEVPGRWCSWCHLAESCDSAADRPV